MYRRQGKISPFLLSWRRRTSLKQRSFKDLLVEMLMVMVAEEEEVVVEVLMVMVMVAGEEEMVVVVMARVMSSSEMVFELSDGGPQHMR
jgi:hypothetical protein